MPSKGPLRRLRDAWIRRLTDLVPNDEHDPEDVHIVGFPKSGHNWVQVLVAGAVYGVDLERAPYRLVWNLVPADAWPYYRRWTTPMFFKSHDLPRPDYRRVVYLVRDGRDVMVSYFHHLVGVRERRGLATDLRAVVEGRYSPTPDFRWHLHTERWLDNPFGARLLVVRYEDLRRDTPGQLARLCEFVGIERTPEQIERAVAQATFEKMRDKEQREGLGRRDWGRGRPRRSPDRPFMRRGVVGSHVDELPPDVLEVFERTAGPTLRRLGYT